MDREKLYEKLGASWFQKVVFKVEKLKFKFIDKFCPNIGNWYFNICDKKANKLCLKAKTEEERTMIRLRYNYKKMAFKKELIEKQNRNYHIDLNNASEFRNYLLWNKKIHKNGMISNGIWIGLCGVAMTMFSGAAFAVSCFWLGCNIVALGVNFQCVNLQNYNLYRFDQKKDILIKIESRKRQKDVKDFAKVGKRIYNNLCERVEMPDSKEVVSTITDVDELMQLRKLALEIKGQREKSDSSKIMRKK